jgi:hypothetical protein
MVPTTFINFDTDGGHNSGGDFYSTVKHMIRECGPVVGGMVTGIGSWVDQECATMMAKLLRGPCLLSLHFPGQDSLTRHCRRDLSAWIRAARTVPVTVSMGAGSTSWGAHHGVRYEDAVEVLGVSVPNDLAGSGRGAQPAFAPPDVSEVTHTRTVIRDLSAGDSFTSYILCRVPPQQLVSPAVGSMGGGASGASGASDAGGHAANQMTVITTSSSSGGSGNEPKEEGTVVLETLSSGSGLLLAHQLLQRLNSSATAASRLVVNKAVLVKRLQTRIEDDLSFQWNLALPNGTTSYLGRAKTTSRAVVPTENQPQEPELAIALRAHHRVEQQAKKMKVCSFGAPATASFGGSFGAPAAGFSFGSSAGSSKTGSSQYNPVLGCRGAPSPNYSPMYSATPYSATPAFSARSPVYSPTSPAYSPASPSYCPTAPAYQQPSQPAYTCALPQEVLDFSDCLRMTDCGIKAASILPQPSLAHPLIIGQYSMTDLMAALQRAVHTTQAAKAAASSGGASSTGAGGASPGEDPLVAAVFGGGTTLPAPASGMDTEGTDAAAVNSALALADQRESSILQSMLQMMGCWWLLLLGPGATSEQVAEATTQLEQHAAPTDLAGLVALLTTCYAKLPMTALTGPFFVATHSPIDTVATGTVGNGGETKGKPMCPSGHTMEASTHMQGIYANGWFCDACKGAPPHPSHPRWACMTCLHASGQGVDYCYQCHPAK